MGDGVVDRFMARNRCGYSASGDACELAARGGQAALDVVVRHRTVALAQSQCVEREMLEAWHAGEFKCLARAVDGAAVDDEDALRLFRHRDEMLYPPADACETGHLTHAFVRKLARNAIREFARIRAVE